MEFPAPTRNGTDSSYVSYTTFGLILFSGCVTRLVSCSCPGLPDNDPAQYLKASEVRRQVQEAPAKKERVPSASGSSARPHLEKCPWTYKRTQQLPPASQTPRQEYPVPSAGNFLATPRTRRCASVTIRLRAIAADRRNKRWCRTTLPMPMSSGKRKTAAEEDVTDIASVRLLRDNYCTCLIGIASAAFRPQSPMRNPRPKSPQKTVTQEATVHIEKSVQLHQIERNTNLLEDLNELTGFLRDTRYEEGTIPLTARIQVLTKVDASNIREEWLRAEDAGLSADIDILANIVSMPEQARDLGFFESD